jgi:hypothetical protein
MPHRPSVAALLVLASFAAALSAQHVGQRFQDGETVEVVRNGVARRAVVRGYAAWGEYSVEFQDGGRPGLNREWVKADQVRAVAAAPIDAPAGPPDLAPLYQAIGSACGFLGCCALPIAGILAIILTRSRRPPVNTP